MKGRILRYSNCARSALYSNLGFREASMKPPGKRIGHPLDDTVKKETEEVADEARVPTLRMKDFPAVLIKEACLKLVSGPNAGKQFPLRYSQ